LGKCKRITDLGLENIGNLTQLNDLNLCNCVNITDTGLEYVGKLTQLTNLDLGGCLGISHDGYHRLKTLRRSWWVPLTIVMPKGMELTIGKNH